MNGDLRINFEGRCGKDATLKEGIGSNGNPYTIASVSLAINKKDQFRDRTIWLRLQMWGKGRAEPFAAKCTKGAHVIGTGSWMTLDQWTNAKGELSSNITIEVDRFEASPPKEQQPAPIQPTETAPESKVDALLREVKERQTLLTQLLEKQQKLGNPFVS